MYFAQLGISFATRRTGRELREEGLLLALTMMLGLRMGSGLDISMMNKRSVLANNLDQLIGICILSNCWIHCKEDGSGD